MNIIISIIIFIFGFTCGYIQLDISKTNRNIEANNKTIRNLIDKL